MALRFVVLVLAGGQLGEFQNHSITVLLHMMRNALPALQTQASPLGYAYSPPAWAMGGLPLIGNLYPPYQPSTGDLSLPPNGAPELPPPADLNPPPTEGDENPPPNDGDQSLLQPPPSPYEEMFFVGPDGYSFQLPKEEKPMPVSEIFEDL